MSDTIVKTETFVSALSTVKLLTVEPDGALYGRYFVILKDNNEVRFTSALFYGGSRGDVIRSCDYALQVVRQLLTETGFLTGEVIGS